MQTPATPTYEYSIDEWVSHFDRVFRSPGQSSKADLMGYFRAQYPDGPEGWWKLKRFSDALAYLAQHSPDFEEFVVVHERRGLVSEPIVVALWRYYARIPDEHLGNAPDVEMIRGFAKEFAG